MKAHWIDDMPAAEYHADPCERPSLSASVANVLLAKTPWHAMRAHPRLGNDKRMSNDGQRLGEVVHALVLGEAERLHVIDVDAYRTIAARDERDDAVARGLIPVKRAFYDQCAEQADSIRKNLRDAGFPLDPRPDLLTERVAIWEENGVLCRGRLDCVDRYEHVIYDLKTTRDGSHRAIERSIREYGYHVQRAAYVSAWEAIEPAWAGRIKFVLLFVEQETNAVIPVEMGSILEDVGRRRWERAVKAWGRCLSADQWPAYATTSQAVIIDADEWYPTRDQLDGVRLNEMMGGVR